MGIMQPIRHSISIQVFAKFCACLTAVSYGANFTLTSSVLFAFEKNRYDQITMTMEEASWIRKIYCITGWGGRLRKRFCNMFSESSRGSMAELQLPCCPSKQGELPENCYKTFSSTCRPRLYICTIDLNPFVTLLSLLIKAI